MSVQCALVIGSVFWLRPWLRPKTTGRQVISPVIGSRRSVYTERVVLESQAEAAVACHDPEKLQDKNQPIKQIVQNLLLPSDHCQRCHLFGLLHSCHRLLDVSRGPNELALRQAGLNILDPDFQFLISEHRPLDKCILGSPVQEVRSAVVLELKC